MHNKQVGFRLTLIAASLVAAFGANAVSADEMDALTKPDSSISIGIGQWSAPRAKMGMFDGQPENGAYLLFDADVNKRDDATGTWTMIRARTRELDDIDFRFDLLRQGDIGGYVEYSQMTRTNPVAFRTGLLGVGSSNMSVSQTATPASPSLLTIASHRDLLHVGLFKRLSDQLDVRFSFKDETKTGTRVWGRGHAAEFLAEPLDSTTNQLDLTLNYTTEKLQLSGGYYGSWYRNRINMVTVNGNVGASSGTTVTPITYLSQPMDNEAHQLFANGGYSFSPTTRGTFKLAYTAARQNEHLPTKDIAGLSFASSPQSLDGRIDTLLAQAGVSSRPFKDLSINANLRYHDLKDKTPVARFVQTNAACGSGQCVDNTPFSISTKSGKLDAVYRLPLGYSLSGGVEVRQQERTIPVANANGTAGADTQRVVPLRSDVDEVTYRIEARKAMSEKINGAAAVLLSQRDGSTYISAGSGPGGTFSDLINPIHLADRDRTKFRLSADWSILDSLSMQLVAEGSKDDYKTTTARPYGLLDGYGKLVSVDINYAITDKWQANAWASYDQTKATQFHRNDSNPALVRTKLVDTGNTAGFGFAGSPSSKIRVGSNVQWARNTSRYPQDLFNLTTNASITNPAPLADVENKAVTLKVFAEYALDKNSELRFDVAHERWQTNDWSWSFRDGSPFVYNGCGVTPTSGCTAAPALANATDGTVAIADQKQISNYAGVRYNFRFQ